jgi:archaetidylinositol phosphate synthase
VALVSSKFKKMFEEMVASSVTPLASLGLTPNILTVMGLVASTAAAWCYLNWSSNPLLLPAAATLLLLSGLLDALDGVLARKTGKASALGGFFDSVADRYSDAVVLGTISVSGLCDPLWGMAALIGSLMVSYARARAEAAGVSMAAVGLAERAERMVLLVAVTLVSYYRIELLGYGIVALAIIANLTVLQRVAHFMGEVKKG